ncbi:MAG: hypothetical protein IPN64_12160 [Propionivibrio sp.]|uniref:hypothetical protein n=1 Tax=Propionivibrio sp. TaxID=2212460 RepID=UPI0025F9B328|nr:hypothetical protein [Propionivibrio sp.]MBK8894765.1 hypothetical protein [Propionivibrio sp.]
MAFQPLAAAFSSPQGLFSRPLSMASFALNFYFYGEIEPPHYFKATNLAIHFAEWLRLFPGHPVAQLLLSH